MDREALFSLVVAETVRPDKAAALPDILLLAEARIARELRCEEMSASDTLDTSTGSQDLPDDFLGLRSVYTDTTALQQVGLSEFRIKRYQRTTFALANGKLFTRVGEVNIDYFARPAPMASDSDTTAVLDAHPDLYVALLCFYVFKQTQDLELAATAEQVYNAAKDTLNELADRQRGAARVGKGYTVIVASTY
jgi:hypothetical protein